MVAKTAKIGVLVGGFVLALFGLAFSHFFEQIIFYRFDQELPLKPGSESFRKWKDTPFPIMMSVYFWNWTNPQRMGEENQVPSFVEMGPYVFREFHEKVNISWNPNGTVTFRTIKRWYFDEERTKGSLDDEVTSVNAVAASASYMVRSWSKFIQYPVSVAMRTSGQELYWTKTVRELLFEGFDNTLQNIGSYIPGFPAQDKFGWFYNRNGTVTSDTYTMATGQKGLHEMGELKLWNYKALTPENFECSRPGGSSGEFWPPKRTKEDVLRMFTTDMCREVDYYFEEESEYRGLKTYIYAGTKETVDNGTIREENKCYCDWNDCPASGVIDVSKCQFGAPVFISYPHFYNGDPVYTESVRGMKPARENHRFYIAVEPRTGLQVDVRARIQVNVFLKKNTAFSIYRNVKDVFIPVFWMENKVSLSEEYTRGVYIMLKIVEFGPFIYYGMCLLGSLIVAGVIVLHLAVYPESCAQKRHKIKSSGAVKGALTKTEDVQMESNGANIKEVEYTFSEI